MTANWVARNGSCYVRLRASRHITVQCFHQVTRFFQTLRHFLGHHHAAVLSPGAPERDRQVTLPFFNVMRQKVQQQFRHARHELRGLRETTYELSDRRILASLVAELGNEVRIGKEAHIEHHVGIQRHAVFEPEAEAGDEQA